MTTLIGGRMGYSKKRVGRNGKPRYTAYYLDRGRERRSAGTFPQEGRRQGLEESRDAAGAGRPATPARRLTFRRYVPAEWLPHHLLEASTREEYA